MRRTTITLALLLAACDATPASAPPDTTAHARAPEPHRRRRSGGPSDDVSQSTEDTVVAWLRRLTADPDPDDADAFRDAMLAMGSDGLDALAQVLRDADDDSEEADLAWAGIRVLGEPAIDIAVPYLTDEHHGPAAAGFFCSLCSHDPRVVELLLAAYGQSADNETRWGLRAALTDHLEALSSAEFDRFETDLLRLSERPDPDVRSTVCELLIARMRRAEPASDAIVDALISRLRDPDRDVRRTVAKALGDEYVVFARVPPRLLDAVVAGAGAAADLDDRECLADLAASLLRRSRGDDPRAAMNVLRDRLRDPDPEVRARAVSILAASALPGHTAPPPSPEVVAALADALGDASAAVREQARCGFEDAVRAGSEVPEGAVRACVARFARPPDEDECDDLATALGLLWSREAYASSGIAVDQRPLTAFVLAELAADDVARRERVVSVIDGAFCDEAPPPPQIVRRLLPFVRDTSSEVRHALLWTLGLTNSPEPAVLAAVGVGLRDENAEVRSVSVGICARWGVYADQAARGLLAEMDREEGRALSYRVATLATLVGVDELVVPRLMELASDDDAGVRVQVMRALADRNPVPAAAAPAFIAALDDSEAGVVRDALRGLTALAATSVDVHARAVTLLHSEDFGVREMAIEALCNWANSDDGVRDALLDVLASGNWYLADKPVAALGDDAASAVPRLMAGVEAGDVKAEDAVRTLKAIGAPARGALVAFLAHDTAAVRIAALQALFDVGVPHETATDYLRRAFADTDPAVRERAAEASRGLEDDVRIVADDLRVLLDDRALAMRVAAVSALLPLGSDDARCVPILARGLLRADTKSSAALVLKWHRAPLPAVVPALVTAIQSDDDLRWVLSALACQGEHAAPAVPVLRRVLRGEIRTPLSCCRIEVDNENESDASLAAQAIAAIGPSARAAVPELMALLDVRCSGDDQESQLQAIVALGHIGPGARAAVPALERAAAIGAPALRDAAATALAAIRTR